MMGMLNATAPVGGGASNDVLEGQQVNWRFVDWIWHVRGSVALAPGQSNDEALDRLEPLFIASGTSHDRTSDGFTFTKKDPAAQDKMSVFDGGTLQIEKSGDGPVLRYHLISRALLFCFLLPLFFLGFAQLAVAIGNLEKPAAKAVAKEKEPEKDYSAIAMNPIDKALGAPAPEKPKKDDKDKKEDGPSTTPAYVFAGLFFALYIVGRFLEDRLAKSLFRKSLFGS